MDRDTWFLNKANQVIELLPDNARSLLSPLRVRSEPRQIQQATLVLFTCQLYRGGWSPDDIAHHWANSGILPADQRTVLEGVVIPARAIFLSCRLSFHRHWNIKQIAFDFLIYNCAHALRAGVPKELLTDDLRTTWLLQTLEGQATVLQEAAMLLNPGVNPPTNLGENDANLAGVFEEMSQNEEVTRLVDLRMNGLRVELKERSDIAGPVRLVHTAAVIHKAIGQSADESEIVEGVRKATREATETIGRWTRTLLPGEVELLRPPEAQTLLLEECVRLTPSVKTGPGGEGATLPDSFHGDFLVPDCVADMAFADGGRFSHNSIGCAS